MSAFIKRVGEDGSFARRFLTLDEAFQVIGASWVEGEERHIKYDPNMEHQYRIIRRQSSDGTLLHFNWLMCDALQNLLDCTSYFKPMGPPPVGHVPVYTVGRIRHAEVFGKVKLACSETQRYPGKRESIIIPVQVEYVLDPEKRARLNAAGDQGCAA